jgi:ABC-type multidrug transport system ATPase subunit
MTTWSTDQDRGATGTAEPLRELRVLGQAGKTYVIAEGQAGVYLVDQHAAHERVLLEELRSRGVSVLLNSHLLSEIELVCDRVAILLRGQLVAEGSPAELARSRGVEIETDDGMRLFDGASRDDAPRLVAELVAEGRKVYGVRVLTSTLEETYLEAVGGETS